jgi:hypothetical protein
MNFFTHPDIPVFEVLQDVDLARPLRSILQPSIPISIISKPILSEAGLEDFIPRFRPGKFVFDFSHQAASLPERWVNLR